MGTDPQIESQDQAIIFFDGLCNLCNGAVQFIIKRDPKEEFKFASLQSPKAVEILSKYNMDPTVMESIILLNGKGLHYKSNAALKISQSLSGLWPLMAIFFIIPKGIRDFVYDWIANNRYKWFGRKDECMVPSANLKSRFVEA